MYKLIVLFFWVIWSETLSESDVGGGGDVFEASVIENETGDDVVLGCGC